MSNRAKRHTHKYHLVKLNFGDVWMCALPDCNHYMPEYLTQSVPGKNSICWKCDKRFILDEYNMQTAQPICDECNPRTNKLTEFLTSDLEKFADKFK
jgi:uncharacterized CHY-type Zn-finger protein